MTTFEHAMLGVDGVLAVGLHRRYHWQLAAMAGFAAASPDWDGLTYLFSSALFAEGHRVWGHNVVACVISGLIIGALDYRYDLITRAGRLLTRLLRMTVPKQRLSLRATFERCGYQTWMIVAIVAALSQLPADMVVSGATGLSDWEVKLFWPFSDRGWVFAMVPWGDPGISVVFIVGMFAMVKRPRALGTPHSAGATRRSETARTNRMRRWTAGIDHIQCKAILTLLGVLIYIVVRGTILRS